MNKFLVNAFCHLKQNNKFTFRLSFHINRNQLIFIESFSEQKFCYKTMQIIIHYDEQKNVWNISY